MVQKSNKDVYIPDITIRHRPGRFYPVVLEYIRNRELFRKTTNILVKPAYWNQNLHQGRGVGCRLYMYKESALDYRSAGPHHQQTESETADDICTEQEPVALLQQYEHIL